jgi:hypothetical protein
MLDKPLSEETGAKFLTTRVNPSRWSLSNGISSASSSWSATLSLSVLAPIPDL